MFFWHKMVQFGFWALFTLVPLIFLPYTSELFEFNKIVVTYLLTVVIAAAWATRMVIERRFIFRRTLLDLPLIFFLLANLVSASFSIDPHNSWFGYYSRFNGGFLSLLAYSLLYWAFVSNMEPDSTRRGIGLAVVAAVPIALWAVAEHFGVDARFWVQDVQARVFSTLGQPNWLAAYLVALIFIPLSTSTNLKNLLIFALFYAVLLFTKSRSGLLAFGIASLVFWGLQKRIVLKLWILMVLGLTAIIPNPVRDWVIKTRTQPLEPKTSLGTQLEAGGTESGAIRKIVWTGALRIWRASTKNFWLGSGPETFALAYYQYRPRQHNQTSEWELLYNKAHNEFLNYLATTGILGLGSYLWLLVSMVRVFIKEYSRSEPRRDAPALAERAEERVREYSNKGPLVALAAGWASLLVTNFWGFSVVITQIFLFLFPALAQTLETQASTRPPHLKKLALAQIFWLGVVGLVGVGGVVAVGRYFLADVRYATGLRHTRTFESNQDVQYLLAAYDSFIAALRLNRSEPTIAAELSVSAAYLAAAFRQEDATLAAQLAASAVSVSDLALAISPSHPSLYKSRARTFILLSEIDSQYLASAAAALAKAAQLSPTDPRLPYNQASIASAQGATASAVLYLAKSLDLKPDFSDAAKQLQELSP